MSFFFFTEVTGSSSFFNKDELSSASLSCSAMKRELQPQTSSFNSKRPRFNVTSFGPSLLVTNPPFQDNVFFASNTLK